MELDPLNANVKCWYGAVLLSGGENKTALNLMEEITATDPGYHLANNGIFFSAFKCKEYDKVIKAEKYLLPVFGITEEYINEMEIIFKEQGFIKAYEKIMLNLEKSAQNNPISPIDMAFRYMMVDQAEKAIDWLEKGFELHDPGMTYIATRMFNFEPLFDHTRFLDIVKKMNLSLPT